MSNTEIFGWVMFWSVLYFTVGYFYTKHFVRKNHKELITTEKRAVKISDKLCPANLASEQIVNTLDATWIIFWMLWGFVFVSRVIFKLWLYAKIGMLIMGKFIQWALTMLSLPIIRK